MSVFSITRSLSVFIPRCRLLLQSEKVSRIARKSVGFHQKTLASQILPTSSFFTSPNQLVYIKMSGLPFRVTLPEIHKFLNDAQVDSSEVLFENVDGRFSGNIYVQVSEEDAPALLAQNKEYIGSRYVFVARTTAMEEEYVIPDIVKAQKENEAFADSLPDNMVFITLKGVPYRSTSYEVKDFIGVPTEVCKFSLAPDGRKTGIVYCLINKADVGEALKKNREYLDTRYIFVEETKPAELSMVMRLAEEGV